MVTLLPVSRLSASEFGNIGGGRTPSLELVEALNAGSEFPHPLGKPGVVWIPVVSISERTTFAQGKVDRLSELGDEVVQLFCRHQFRDVDFSCP